MIRLKLISFNQSAQAQVIQRAVRTYLSKRKSAPLHIGPAQGNLGYKGIIKAAGIETVFPRLLAAIPNGKSVITKTFTAQELAAQEIPTIKLGDLSDKDTEDYGRTRLHLGEDSPSESTAVKTIKPGEEESELLDELRMQKLLAIKKAPLNLRSEFPIPQGIVSESKGLAVSFKTNPAYYDYVSQIKSEPDFIEALSTSAFDLGRLLRHNLGFHQLFSMFHGDGRSYTCFPKSLGLQVMANGDDFAGKLAHVVGVDLYENMGKLGVRDVGDMVFIDNWGIHPPTGDLDMEHLQSTGRFRNHKPQYTEPQKLMHFISLYLFAFGIMIAKRAENFEATDPGIWERSAKLFKTVSKKLFEGLDIPQPSSIPLDSARFNEQFRFGFTKHRESLDLEPYPSSFEEDDISVLIANTLTKPTPEQVTRVFGSAVRWEESMPDFFNATYPEDDEGFSVEHGFGINGNLGMVNGALPLLELMRCTYSLTAEALDKLYLQE